MTKHKHNQKTCTCAAYPFPHKMGSGSCNREKMSGPFCRDCGSNDIRLVDNGIGLTEFWGSRSYHTDICQECRDCGGENISGRLEPDID